jgi:superfamily II DNA/RNA helicase
LPWGHQAQSERDWVLDQFKRGECTVLVATDVASRGLDISDVMLVINHDMPKMISDYIHRIGRTGRAGRSGTSYSFFTCAPLPHRAAAERTRIARAILEGVAFRVPERGAFFCFRIQAGA